MGLSFGWKTNDVRDTIWRGDPALKNVPEHVIESWRQDGDALHLQPYATAGDATVFQFRSLNAEESRLVFPHLVDNSEDGLYRAFLLCFRMGVSFPGVASIRVDDPQQGPTNKSIVVREKGIQMLALPFVGHLETKYPGIVTFYGALILNSTFPTEPEKKASSPLSTPTPLSVAANTKADATGYQDATVPPLA